MLRAGLGLILALACAGCAANTPQPAGASSCPAGEPSASSGPDCAGQPGITVHLGGTVSYGMGVR